MYAQVMAGKPQTTELHVPRLDGQEILLDLCEVSLCLSRPALEFSTLAAHALNPEPTLPDCERRCL